MARARNADKAAESAQEAREAQDMSQDTQGAGAQPGAAEDGQERPDEEQLAECVLTECAVTGCEALNLRELPDLSARVQADDRSGSLTTALGASFGCAEQPPRQPAAAQGPVDGWLFVRTGRLEGWMMAKYLEALPLPELSYGAE